VQWTNAHQKEREALIIAIKKRDLETVKKWFSKREPSIRDLRKEARNHGVANYSRLSKNELLWELKEIKK